MDQAYYLHLFHCLPACDLKALKLIAKHKNLEQLWQSQKIEDLVKLGIYPIHAQKLLSEKRKLEPERIINLIKKAGVSLVTKHSSYYPRLLKHIHSPPALLYAKGNIQLLRAEKPIAIVGTRRMSGYGASCTKQIINDLKSTNASIVSGAAFGIDNIALTASLDAGLPSIAVLGSGVLNPTPASNAQLFHRLFKDGLVISEYLPQAGGTKYTFPERNRLISGISKATIVVEAPFKSGAIITANFAEDQGREVYAVPGPINVKTSQGTNSLIAKPQAIALANPRQLIKDLNLLVKPSGIDVRPKLSTPVQQIILGALKAKPLNLSQLSSITKIRTDILISQLVQLELAQQITETSGYYSRISTLPPV